MRLVKISLKEIIFSLFIAVFLYLFLAVLTGILANPFFARMTPVVFFDYFLLGLEAIIMGFLLGIKSGACSYKITGAGGILGFLGFACPVCNKILLYIFGAAFLLTYFEPIRHYVGVLGVFILLYLLYKKIMSKRSFIDNERLKHVAEMVEPGSISEIDNF